MSDHVLPPFTMTEHVCRKRATYIANLSLEAFRPIADASRQQRFKGDPRGTYKRIKNWALKHASSEGGGPTSLECTYRFAHGKNYGRIFSSMSVQGAPRDIRGFVCVSEDTGIALMTDLDMDACHPTILLWLCRKNGIVCAYVALYVADPARYKEELADAMGIGLEEAKAMFLAAVNSDAEASGKSETTEFFKRFDAECKAIQQAFVQLAEYRHLLPDAQRSADEKLEERKAARRRERKTTNGLHANVAGCFMNLILCTWESRFLGIACKTLEEMVYEVCVNNFDGIMIKGDHYPPGNASKARDGVICPALEAALHEAFGVKMGWSMKRHATALVYSEESGLKMAYAKHAEAFLEKVCRVGCEYYLTLDDDKVVIESGGQLAERFKAETSQCILGDKEWHSRTFAETLCRDPAMRSYDRADMYPDEAACPPRVYNLWKPMPCAAWDVARADPASEHVAAFRHHIRILADHDESVAAFIENFLAHMLHHPARKPGAWLVLLSEEGAGKGTLVRLIALLIGKSKVKELSNAKRSLFGSFNQCLLDAFVVVLDEATDMFGGKEELKHLISEPTVVVNQKNVKEVELRSFARFILTSQPRAVPTERGDRRGVIVRCSDELIGNAAYFREINARMDSHEAIADFHAYLMTLSPPAVFPVEELPQTEVARATQAGNANVFDTWVSDVVDTWFNTDGTSILTPRCATVMVDYLGDHAPTNTTPEFAYFDMFKHFQRYAERINASQIADKLTYHRFISKFETCRWRALFQKTKHKVSGDQKYCRAWDMRGLARDLDIEVPEAAAAPPPAALSAPPPAPPATALTAPPPAARLDNEGQSSTRPRNDEEVSPTSNAEDKTNKVDEDAHIVRLREAQKRQREEAPGVQVSAKKKPMFLMAELKPERDKTWEIAS